MFFSLRSIVTYIFDPSSFLPWAATGDRISAFDLE